jgi:hypothetical protein
MKACKSKLGASETPLVTGGGEEFEGCCAFWSGAAPGFHVTLLGRGGQY